jgi:hypothetical protein
MNRCLAHLFVLSVAAAPALGACANDDATASNDEELNTRGTLLFACKTDRPMDGSLREIAFSVKSMGSRSMEINAPDGSQVDYDPIKVTPGNSRITSLNENLDFGAGTRHLRINGDSDGFYLSELVLYKNSGWTKGFVRIYASDPDESGPNEYSKLSCTVTPKR